MPVTEPAAPLWAPYLPERDDRPRLLYVSPVMPSPTGNGLAMRAGAVLRALAERYCVSLLVDPRYAGEAWPDPAFRRACERIAVVQAGGPTAALFLDDRFDVVHVFRLAAVAAAQPYLAHAGSRHLDLDDVESETHRRLASLHLLNGDGLAADGELAQAKASARSEDDALAAFDRVYVCSEQDRAGLAGRGPADVRVLPNTLPVPGPLPLPPTDQPFTFLFTGTLSYYPNEDGARWWCGEVLAKLRTIADRPFRLTVVGTNADAVVGDLAAYPEVTVVGRVPDLGPWYERAGAVIVPVRAGGGTRIKLLEAFGYRRPVVTTTLGAEGIAAQHERELLLADTPIAFAEQCARLLADPDLRGRLTEAAVELLVRAYQPSALAGPLFGGVPALT